MLARMSWKYLIMLGNYEKICWSNPHALKVQPCVTDEEEKSFGKVICEFSWSVMLSTGKD